MSPAPKFFTQVVRRTLCPAPFLPPLRYASMPLKAKAGIRNAVFSRKVLKPHNCCKCAHKVCYSSFFDRTWPGVNIVFKTINTIYVDILKTNRFWWVSSSTIGPHGRGMKRSTLRSGCHRSRSHETEDRLGGPRRHRHSRPRCARVE